jgi:hypothetical protein
VVFRLPAYLLPPPSAILPGGRFRIKHKIRWLLRYGLGDFSPGLVVHPTLDPRQK